MKSISAAIQAIIDADSSRPVTAVTITLTDGTVLYVADQAATISAQVYQPHLIRPPGIVVSREQGIDHTTLALNNADNAYSAYDNQDLFDGAKVSISQYFATDAAYTTFEGPILAFTGIISQPVTSGSGELTIVVMADARIQEGVIGRTITGRCLNVFRDANCGYTHSATVSTGGTYTADVTWIPLSETAVSGQSGSDRAPVMQVSLAPAHRVKITRGGTTIYGGDASTPLYISGNGFSVGSDHQVRLNQTVTLQVGDKIEYVTCPRSSMDACAMRWQLGSASRQQDHFMGFAHNDRTGPYFKRARYPDLVGRVVPLLWGHRWIEPIFAFAHKSYTKNTKDWAAWNADRKGPMVFGLLSEGPIVATPIEDFDLHVELDGALAAQTEPYKNGVDAHMDVRIGAGIGAAKQTVSDYAPSWAGSNAGATIPGLPGMHTVAHFAIDLPDDYDLSPTTLNQAAVAASRAGARKRSGGTVRGGIGPSYLTPIYSFGKPALRMKVKGRTVYTWSFVGSTPTKGGARAYSENPVWLLLDVLTSPQRHAQSDEWSVGVDEADLDMASFVNWADYCDDTIEVETAEGVTESVTRYTASLYDTDGDRETTIRAFLDVMRGSLVPRDGKVGVILDAPLGGKGTATGGTASTLVDSRRTDTDEPDVPSWPDGGVNGLLEGLKVKILSGTGAGQTRTVASNTQDTITVTTAWTTTPDATSVYAIYAVELTTSNCGNVTREKSTASHSLTNQVVVNFASDEHRGAPASVAVADSVEDDLGRTHVDRFGLNETSFDLRATTTWQQAVRDGWYRLRSGLDRNRRFKIESVNVEGMPLEVGDLVLFSHDIDGVENEIVQVERIEQDSTVGAFAATVHARLYREHVYTDWPTGDFGGFDIASSLIPPHGIPGHVSDLVAESVKETGSDQPLVKVTYTLPSWPYAGWHVAIEARRKDDSGEWQAWTPVATSGSASASFRAPRVAEYEIRVVFVSHVGVRADATLDTGTATAGGATSLTDSSKAWTTDAYVGYYARLTAGTGADAEDHPEREIQSNTGTVLTVDPAWTTNPDNTSDYQVYSPPPREVVDVSTLGDNVISVTNARAHFDSDPAGATVLRAAYNIRYGESVESVQVAASGTRDGVLTEWSYYTNSLVSFDRLVDPAVPDDLDLLANTWSDITVTLTPYDEVNGVDGTGTAGVPQVVTISAPSVSGVGHRVLPPGGGTAFAGREIELRPMLNAFAAATSGNPAIGLRGVHEADVSGTWTHDYADGASVEANMAGDTTVNAPSGINPGEPISMRITTNGYTLSFGTGWETPRPLPTLAGVVAISGIKFSSVISAGVLSDLDEAP